MKPALSQVTIYTDGSCHTQRLIGGWAAILFIGTEKIVLTGTEPDTTHNRMELLAVIRAIEYIRSNHSSADAISIVSDSQYVVGLRERSGKLSAHHFLTKAGKEIQNADLVKQFLGLVSTFSVAFTKVKAHQKKDDAVNHNIEVDRLSRKLVRDAVGAPN